MDWLTRLGRVILATLLFWVAALLSSLLVGPGPDCYLEADWDGTRWHYGRLVCLPEVPDPRPAPPSWAPAMDPETAWLEMDADLLARVALEEDPRAAAAVMWVVINRADGRLLEEVATPKAFHGLRHRTRLVTPWDLRRWGRLQETAWKVLLGLLPDPTGGADHFHRAGTWTPPWAPEAASWRILGSHAFYSCA